MIESTHNPNPIGEPMVQYVKLQTSYYLDPAVADLSDAAEVALTRSFAYCGSAESHGYVPRSALGSILRTNRYQKRTKIVAELVDANLWIEVEGGWQLRTWHENQPEVEGLLTRRDNERKRQQKHRAKGVDKSGDTETASRDIPNGLARSREDQSREDLTPLLTLVRRQLFGNARTRSTTTDDELLGLWADECSPADVGTELKAWLIHNADRQLTNPSAALLGWLRAASKRGQLVMAPGCAGCIRGWIADEYGQPSERRCSSCRPGLQAVAGEA